MYASLVNYAVIIVLHHTNTMVCSDTAYASLVNYAVIILLRHTNTMVCRETMYASLVNYAVIIQTLVSFIVLYPENSMIHDNIRHT